MTEEALEEVDEEIVDEEIKEEVVPYVSHEPDEVKEEAREQGWTDFNEWTEAGKDPKEWRPASVFIERGVLFKQHGELKKRSEELTSQLKVLGEHNKKIAQVERDKAIKELKEEKLEALENQDHKRVMDLDDKIAEVNAIPEVVAPETNPIEDITFDQWMAEGTHDWYKDPLMGNQADIAGAKFRQDNPDAKSSEVFEYAEKYVKEKNPKEFKKDVGIPKVGSTDRTTGDTGKQKDTLPSIKSLPFEFQKVAKSFEQTGVMTVKEYIQQTNDLAKAEGKTLDEYIRSLNLS